MTGEYDALLARLEEAREVWSESKGCLTKKRRNPDGPAAAKIIRDLTEPPASKPPSVPTRRWVSPTAMNQRQQGRSENDRPVACRRGRDLRRHGLRLLEERSMTHTQQSAGLVARQDWQPIATAPRDGTTIQARIPGHGDDNLIAWVRDTLEGELGPCGSWSFVSEQEPPDDWTDGWCWASNEDGLPSTQPTHWKATTPTADEGGENV